MMTMIMMMTNTTTTMMRGNGKSRNDTNMLAHTLTLEHTHTLTHTDTDTDKDKNSREFETVNKHARAQLPIAHCTILRQWRLCFDCLAFKCTILSKFSNSCAYSLSLARQLSNLDAR
jgi:hypothetical protein